jgi:hypothetical protein
MKLKLMLLNVGILSLLVTGCGKNLNGNYTGTDTLAQTATGATGSYQPTNGYGSQMGQMTVALTQSGDTVTGTWTESVNGQSGITGKITGVMSGGSLGSIQMYPTGTVSSSAGVGCSYTGSLNIGDNNLLSGTLTSAGSTSGSSYGCTGYTSSLNLYQQGS